MKHFPKFLLGALLWIFALAHGAAADFSMGGDVVLSTNAVRYEERPTNNSSGDYTTRREWQGFDGFAFGDTNLWMRFGWERFGIKLTVKPQHPSSTTNWWYGWFDDSYLWWDMLDVSPGGVPLKLRVQAGDFESRHANRVNSVVDKWQFGGFYYNSGTANAETITTLLETTNLVESEFMRHLLLSFSAGPVTVDWSPVGYGDLSPTSSNFLRGGAITSVNEDRRNILSSWRLYTEPLFNGMFQATAAYSIVYKWQRPSRNKLNGERGRDNPEQQQFIHRYSAIAELHTPGTIGLDVTAAYSGQVNLYNRNWGDVFRSYPTDIVHTVDLRERWTPPFFDTLTIEGHHKLSFGRGMGDAPLERYENEAQAFDTPNQNRWSNTFVLWNALGAAWQFRDDMRLTIIVQDRYARATQKAADNHYDANEIQAEALFRYYVTANAYIETGASFTRRHWWAWQNGQAVENDTTPESQWNVAVPLKVSFSF